ncbi:NAD(P)H-dependent oxidoreductase [Aquimarina sp. U1-2]|uniref:FMN-dependent NADH-azoreductase n=1 Tax=Aquimarina sp. U1-2 TaxID=2823141 RepID=UPI001AECF170|nr:NAD(P)H-dependent oxidoreductase [Aquimarina sp. U1-2]MBP2831096.1 NAD(P)H-dependent oxidoreductase [Aquimarina sp. U1-2]
MKILHIDSSIRGDRSVSRQLTKYTCDLIKESSNVEIDYLDLSVDTPNHINQQFMDAQHTPVDELSIKQHQLLSESNTLIERLENADIYVVGLPMYNFTFPSSFKTFLDNVMVSGKTFKSDETGEEGLLKNKKAIIISSSGGMYNTSPTEAYNCLSPLITACFGYIGITDITPIKTEATAFYGPEKKAKSIIQSRKDLERAVNKLTKEKV